KPPLMSTGIRMMPMRNDFDKTAARYSRAAMTSILRMGVLLRVRPGDANEDVVQGGPGQLEVAHLAAARQEGEQRLGVGARREAQLLEAAKIANRLDAGELVPAGCLLL